MGGVEVVDSIKTPDFRFNAGMVAVIIYAPDLAAQQFFDDAKRLEEQAQRNNEQAEKNRIAAEQAQQKAEQAQQIIKYKSNKMKFQIFLKFDPFCNNFVTLVKTFAGARRAGARRADPSGAGGSLPSHRSNCCTSSIQIRQIGQRVTTLNLNYIIIMT